MCDSQHTACWERYAPSRKVCINREYVFRSLSIKNCLDAIMWDLHICPVDLTSRVRGQFVSCTFWASLTHSYGVPELPMRKGVAEVSESAGCHTVVTLMKWHPTVHRPAAGSCKPPTCFRNSKGWPQTLSVRRNSYWIDFQAVARPYHFRAIAVQVTQLCLTLYDTMEYTVH